MQTANKGLLFYGEPLEQAQAAVILVHGRGASAESMLPLAEELHSPRLGFLVPQAPGSIWYPYPFMAPISQNEPHLSRALDRLAGLFTQLQNAGLPAERVMLMGFSQGASLSLEYTARHPRRYGGVAGLSGGLIGPAGTQWNTPGSLAGTPVFLGCSDVDPFIPKERVLESARALETLGGKVTTRLYPAMDHTVNQDELDFVREMLKSILATNY